MCIMNWSFGNWHQAFVLCLGVVRVHGFHVLVRSGVVHVHCQHRTLVRLGIVHVHCFLRFQVPYVAVRLEFQVVLVDGRDIQFTKR